MRNITQIAKRTERLITDNAPALLTAIGVTGTVTTAYLTGKATFKAAKIIDDEQTMLNVKRAAGEQQHDLTTGEKAKLVWKEYLPPAGAGALTVGCIIGANYVGTRRTAAIAAALTLSEKAAGEYKEKVLEKFGQNKEREVRDGVAADRVRRDFEGKQVVLVEGTGKVWCHDAYSGRPFQSTVEEIRKAVNEINRQIERRNEGSATVSDFYDKIGLSHTSISDEFGWNSDDMLELSWTTVPLGDGLPAAHSYDFETRPILRPWSSQSFR